MNEPVSKVLEATFMKRESRPPFDCVTGGPPCQVRWSPLLTALFLITNLHIFQGFSYSNMFQFVEDSRKIELLVLLSAIAEERPLYGVMENVAGLVHYRLPDLNPDGTQGSYLYLAVEILLDLGYQSEVVRFPFPQLLGFSLNHFSQQRKLQAASYGVPQDRTRMILVFALRGFPLPNAPTPTHAYSQGTHFSPSWPSTFVLTTGTSR